VNIIPPLICWLVWKDANPLVDKVGKNILNAQISWAIYTVAACLSCLILIGFVLAPVVVIAWIVFSIIAAVKAAKGNARDIFSPRRNAAKGKRPFCLRYRVHTLPLSGNCGLSFPTRFRTFPRAPADNRKNGFLCFPSDLPSFSPPLNTRRFLQSPWNILYRPSL